jgi:hypothetical protein
MPSQVTLPPSTSDTPASGPDDDLTARPASLSDVETVPEAGSLVEEPALGDRPESVDEPVDATVPSKTLDVTPASDVSATEAAVADVTPASDVTPVSDVSATDEAVAELSPGDVAIDPVAALWPAEAAEALRERWRDLQLRFVDDPHNAAAEADFLVGEAIETLTSSLASLRGDLANWRSEGGGDTERLRVAVQGYRGFLDRILGL